MATVSSSNFSTNSLIGTTVVRNGFANISLPLTPYVLEGDKEYSVKLRRDSATGTILVSVPTQTIRDRSAFVSLTANTSSINEGDLVTYTLVMANAANNANLFYSIIPFSANLTQSDFFANTGVVTIINNQAVFTVRANVDAGYSDETGESFRLQLRQGSPTGNIFFTTTANVAIVDIYKLVNYISLIESASAAAESDTVTFTFTAHNVAPGTVFYYDTVGNVVSSTFSTGNTGSFVMNSISNVISLAGATGVPANQTRFYQLNIRSGNANGFVAMTSNVVTLVDDAAAFITATGGIILDRDGYRIHSFNTSSVLNITSTGAGLSKNMEILSIAGGGGGGGQPGQGGSGGGAGGYVYMPSVSAILGNLTVTIGAGGSTPGSGGAPFAANGSNTSVTGANFANILSVGGGKGGLGANPGDNMPGGNGGSGGGSGYYTANAGTGYGFPGPAQQGFPGGSSVITTSPFTWTTTTGGGGAGAAGSSGTYTAGGNSGSGGIGKQTNISGSNVFYAGGGGGGIDQAGHEPRRGLGGNGGGGRGGLEGNVNSGGGGGGGEVATGHTGGSGIVIIRYPALGTYAVIDNVGVARAVTDNTIITYSVTTYNVANTTLYWTMSGNVANTDVLGGNTGSFALLNNNATFSFSLANNIVSGNDTKEFTLQVRKNSVTGGVAATANTITVYAGSNRNNFVSATGGTIVDTGKHRLHIFTSSANLVVSNTGRMGGYVDYLSVAGGGGGGYNNDGYGGAGGAGGLLSGTTTISAQTYVTTVGAGAASGVRNTSTNNGSNTSIFGLTSVGGGGGNSEPNGPGRPGGSGGGGQASSAPGSGGSGITGQGNPGSSMIGNPNGATLGSGGGGAGGTFPAGQGAGYPGYFRTTTNAGGGIGLPFTWVPTAYGSNSTSGQYFAGGGGGTGTENSPGFGQGGLGGGGQGAGPGGPGYAFSGNVNTGGGGGSGSGGPGGATLTTGGSGIVIIRYPYV